MLVRESRTSSANGAFGRHERQDNRSIILSIGSAIRRASQRKCVRGKSMVGVPREQWWRIELGPVRDEEAQAITERAVREKVTNRRWIIAYVIVGILSAVGTEVVVVWWQW
jgi:hypothetical protein